MILKYLNGNKENFTKKLLKALEARKIHSAKNSLTVRKIINDVKKNKDFALLKYEKKFSKLKKITINQIKFSEDEIKKIISRLDNKTKTSIDLAFKRIYNFHKKQKFIKYKTKDVFKNHFTYKKLI